MVVASATRSLVAPRAVLVGGDFVFLIPIFGSARLGTRMDPLPSKKRCEFSAGTESNPAKGIILDQKTLLDRSITMMQGHPGRDRGQARSEIRRSKA